MRGKSLMFMEELRERALDQLADVVRQNLDMEAVYRILRGGDAACGRWKGGEKA